ncbi:TPA: UDP-glucose 4-epimerase family protein [Vibrio parahaemolyticus]|uniref:UDP-glucose 4-epimerase family protein n=1 Tax=Vibrio parahaemolyticus TaxID=670 RepID=UPI00084BC2B3|nr:SDR family oxidoreductase [Vibrio parahaemolyticus]EJE4699977.1 SDR family oxidoreductase [Vibrio parahaemolyticus]ELA9558025.1 SDR family oxidoreductase [Vibrio parahaemolyticus]ODX35903.1 UDP-glucose 4-epimerase [Vibrio parahaemolyticus]OMP50393.1 UDP-glucose 4-epimerase [Vibrio parahaemolyticus]TXM12534.1 SDR family oxidoreductase [Vibrio parahaemolyticus]
MIFITGSNGFLGSHLVKRLGDQTLSLLDRGSPKNSPKHRFLQAEINGISDYTAGLKGCNTVIHCAARVHIMDDSVDEQLEAYREVNTRGTSNLAKQAAELGVKRFIFVSSIKVNGEKTESGKPFNNLDKHLPEDDYGVSKAEAEQQLFDIGKEAGMEIVVIRPTLVYGPGVKANFASLMRLVAIGVPLPFGCIRHNQRSLVSVENLVDLIVTCIDHPKAANETFLVSDDNDISTSKMVRQMAIALDKPTWQLPVPVWCYQLAGKLFGKSDVVDRLIGSLQVDITHTKETLDWIPPQSLEEGFRETAQALLNSKK